MTRKILIFLCGALNALGSTIVDPSLSFINVGQGNCVIVDCGEGSKLVVDCGSTGTTGVSSSTGQKKTKDELVTAIKKEQLNEGGKKILILVTHPDKDHLNLLSKIFKEPEYFEEMTVLLGGSFDQYFETTENFNLLKHFSEKFVQIIPLSHGIDDDTVAEVINRETTLEKLAAEKQEISKKKLQDFLTSSPDLSTDSSPPSSPSKVKREGFCRKFDIEILAANVGNENNGQSVVLKLKHTKSNQTAILTGDATKKTTDFIQTAYPDKADFGNVSLLLASHHGANEHGCNKADWINFLNPQSVIFSSGIYQKFLHPRCDVFERYYNKNSIRKNYSHAVTCGSNKLRPIIPGVRVSYTDYKDKKTGMVTFFKCDMEKAIYNTHDSGTIKAIFKDNEMEIINEKESESLKIEVPSRSPTKGSRLTIMATPLRRSGSVLAFSSVKRTDVTFKGVSTMTRTNSLSSSLKSSSKKLLSPTPVVSSTNGPLRLAPKTSVSLDDMAKETGNAVRALRKRGSKAHPL